MSRRRLALGRRGAVAAALLIAVAGAARWLLQSRWFHEKVRAAHRQQPWKRPPAGAWKSASFRFDWKQLARGSRGLRAPRHGAGGQAAAVPRRLDAVGLSVSALRRDMDIRVAGGGRSAHLPDRRPRRPHQRPEPKVNDGGANAPGDDSRTGHRPLRPANGVFEVEIARQDALRRERPEPERAAGVRSARPALSRQFAIQPLDAAMARRTRRTPFGVNLAVTHGEEPHRRSTPPTRHGRFAASARRRAGRPGRAARALSVPGARGGARCGAHLARRRLLERGTVRGRGDSGLGRAAPTSRRPATLHATGVEYRDVVRAAGGFRRRWRGRRRVRAESMSPALRLSGFYARRASMRSGERRQFGSATLRGSDLELARHRARGCWAATFRGEAQPARSRALHGRLAILPASMRGARWRFTAPSRCRGTRWCRAA